MNMEKMTTGMSLEGPKMGGGRYGSDWSGRKMAKSGDPIRARPTAAGREISRRRSSGGGTPPWPAHVARWWPESASTTKTRMT